MSNLDFYTFLCYSIFMSKSRTHRNLHKRPKHNVYKPRNFEAIPNSMIRPSLLPTPESQFNTNNDTLSPGLYNPASEKLWNTYPEWASDETVDYVNSILGIYEPWETVRQERKAKEQRIAAEAAEFADSIILSLKKSKAEGTFDYDKVLENDPSFASEDTIAEINFLLGYPDKITLPESPVNNATDYRSSLSTAQEISLLRHQSSSWEFVYKRRRFNRLRKAGKKIVAFTLAATTLFGAYNLSSNNSSASITTIPTTENIDTTTAYSDPVDGQNSSVDTEDVTQSNNLNQEQHQVTQSVTHADNYEILLSTNQEDLSFSNTLNKDYSLLPWTYAHDILKLQGTEISYALNMALNTFNDMYNQDFREVNGQYQNSAGHIMNQEQVEDLNFILDSLSA